MLEYHFLAEWQGLFFPRSLSGPMYYHLHVHKDRLYVQDWSHKNSFRVIDPEKAIIQVENFYMATSELAQTTLRSVLGQHELDEMLSERDRLNADVQSILDQQTDAWGIKVSNVEIKHVDLDESMIRAIAKQAEAERTRRAKVIHAEGELQASEKLLQAAEILSGQSQALQLRYLQTLTDIAGERSNTIVFPLPMDVVENLIKKKE